MTQPLKPGRALITGGGARIGRHLAETLGGTGWDVAVHYRTSTEGAEAACEAILASGGKAAPVQADLSVETETAALVGKASKALGGPLTLLVNNASLFVEDEASTHSRTDWDRHMDTNLRAPILLAQQFSAGLPADESGLVVNLIDQRVLKLNPTFFTYTLSKTALWTATRTLAQALAPRIRVNAIGPGPTLKATHQSDAEFSTEASSTLTGKGAQPGDIASALIYLIGAPSVTGQMIVCDGGQHLLWQTPDMS